MNLKSVINDVTPQQHTLENQPREWPRFYLFPATEPITPHLSPANDPLYHLPCPAPVSENPVQCFINQQRELVLQLVADTRAAIITATRATVRWLFWHVAIPVAAMASLYISFASPAELPM